jgi:hypothetical protein
VFSRIVKKAGIPYRAEKGKMRLGVGEPAIELWARTASPSPEYKKIIIPNP